jgi:hypothetical protein
VRYFRTLVQAANAFVNAPAPFRQIVYDDGCTARELDENRALGAGIPQFAGILVRDVTNRHPCRQNAKHGLSFDRPCKPTLEAPSRSCPHRPRQMGSGGTSKTDVASA